MRLKTAGSAKFRWAVAAAAGAVLALPLPGGYGSGLMVVAAWFLAVAWFSYLKRDGLRFLDPKLNPATRRAAEESEEAGADGSTVLEARARSRARSRAFTKDAALAGALLFIVALAFQYRP